MEGSKGFGMSKAHLDLGLGMQTEERKGSGEVEGLT